MRLGISIVLLLTACDGAPAAVEAPILYGEDDRVEPFEASVPALAVALDASPAIFHADDLDESDPERVLPLAFRLGDAYGLCDDERFADELSASFCSATLIDDDLIATAGHCIEETPCEELRFVFGWEREVPGETPHLTAGDVFRCRTVIAGGVAPDRDVALIQLDRPTGRTPVTVREAPPALDESLYLVGYPSGLPLMISLVGRATVYAEPTLFFHSLDSLPGSSGGGVYDLEGRFVGVHYAAGARPTTLDAERGCSRFTVASDLSIRSGLATTVPMVLSLLCRSRYPAVACGRTPQCGDGFCSHGEDETSCFDDCPICGDGVCGTHESCAADCPVTPPPSAGGRCTAGPHATDGRGFAVIVPLIAWAARRRARRASTGNTSVPEPRMMRP